MVTIQIKYYVWIQWVYTLHVPESYFKSSMGRLILTKPGNPDFLWQKVPYFNILRQKALALLTRIRFTYKTLLIRPMLVNTVNEFKSLDMCVCLFLDPAQRYKTKQFSSPTWRWRSPPQTTQSSRLFSSLQRGSLRCLQSTFPLRCWL